MDDMHLGRNPGNGGSRHCDSRNVSSMNCASKILFWFVRDVWFRGMFCDIAWSNEQKSRPTFPFFRLQRDKVPKYELWIEEKSARTKQRWITVH